MSERGHEPGTLNGPGGSFVGVAAGPRIAEAHRTSRPDARQAYRNEPALA